MCVHGVDRDRLRLGALVNHIAGGWFDLFGNDSARHAGNPNFTFVIGGIEAVAAQMAVVVINVPTVGIRHLELCAGNKIAGYTVFLLNHQCTSLGVPKGELLHTSALDFDVLGRAIKDIALHSLDFAGDNSGTRLNALQNNFTRFVGVIAAIVRANGSPGTVHYLEAHPAQWLVLSPFNELPNY